MIRPLIRVLPCEWCCAYVQLLLGGLDATAETSSLRERGCVHVERDETRSGSRTAISVFKTKITPGQRR